MNLTKNLIFSLVSITIIASASIAHASAGGAGNDGGGGGGICINGKCMTLAEAGLRVEGPKNDGLVSIPAPAIPMPTFKIFENTLANFISLYDDFSIFERPSSWYISTYERVSVYDPAALKVIRDQYIELLRQNNFPSQNLELFAVSNAEKTYLLPEFFKLSPESQMKVIFHEELMKRYLKYSTHEYSGAEALKIILAFDDGFNRARVSDYSGMLAVARGLYAFQQKDERGRANPLSGVHIATYVKAAIIKQASKNKNKYFLQIDPRILGLFTSSRIFLTPENNSNISYEEIEMWQIFNQTMPELSRAFQIAKVSNVGGAVVPFEKYKYVYGQDLVAFCLQNPNGAFITNKRGQAPVGYWSMGLKDDRFFFEHRKRNSLLVFECKNANPINVGMFEATNDQRVNSSLLYNLQK